MAVRVFTAPGLYALVLILLRLCLELNGALSLKLTYECIGRPRQRCHNQTRVVINSFNGFNGLDNYSISTCVRPCSVYCVQSTDLFCGCSATNTVSYGLLHTDRVSFCFIGHSLFNLTSYIHLYQHLGTSMKSDQLLKRCCSPVSTIMLLGLLLLSGDVEPNPGPCVTNMNLD